MNIPPIFENCSYFYSKKFLYFADCFEAADPCANLRQWNDIRDATIYGILLVPSIISLIALVLNIYIFGVSIPNFRNMHEDTQKRYIFLISKTISAILLSSAIVSESIYMITTNMTFWALAFFIFWNQFSYISYVGTYIGSSFSTYLAIVRPFVYRKYMTVKITLICGSINIILSAIFAGLVSIVQAAYMSPDAPFHCDYEHCYFPFLILIISDIVITFLLTFFTILFSVISLYRHQKRSETLNDVSNSETIPIILRRMTATLIVLVFVAIFEISVGTFLMFNVLSIHIFNFQDTCSMFYQSDDYLNFLIMMSIFVNLWTFGIILDPIAVLLFDPLISKWPKRHLNKMSVMLTIRRTLPRVTDVSSYGTNVKK